MKKVFFFGDSNTYGYDPAGFMGGRYPYAARWTTILQELLSHPSGVQEAWEVSADGLPGRALPVTRYEWDYLASVLCEEMPFTLFAVMLGTNDLLSTLHPDAAHVARNMDSLLSFVGKVLDRESSDESREAAGTGGSRPELMIIAPPRIVLTDQSYREPYVCGDRTYAQVYHEEGQKLARYYRELASYRGVRFADASEWELDFAYDGVHLSEQGHARFAAQMASVLREISPAEGQ